MDTRSLRPLFDHYSDRPRSASPSGRMDPKLAGVSSSQILTLQIPQSDIVMGLDWSSLCQQMSKHLTRWGRVTHICVSRLTITGSDNCLSPGRRQAIIWTSAGIVLIGPLGTNFSENLIEILSFSFTKMRLKMSSAKWRPFCLGLKVLAMLGHQWTSWWLQC